MSELRWEKAKPGGRFPGFVQLVTLISLVPVVYSGLIFTLYGSFSLDFTYFELGDGGVREKLTLQDLSYFNKDLGGLVFAAFYAVGMLLYPIALIYCLVRRHWGWLLFGLSVYHMICAILIDNFLFGRGTDLMNMNWERFQAEYISAAAYVAFFWFIVFGRLRSKTFYLFVATCLALAVLFRDVGQDETPFFVYLSPIILLLISCLVGKLFQYAIVQNFDQFREAGFAKSSIVLLKSIFYWLPLFFLVILPIQWFNHLWYQAIEDTVYNFKVDQKYSTHECDGVIVPAFGEMPDMPLKKLEEVSDLFRQSSRLFSTSDLTEQVKTFDAKIKAVKQSTKCESLVQEATHRGRIHDIDIPWSIAQVLGAYNHAWQLRLKEMESELTKLDLGVGSYAADIRALIMKEFDATLPAELGLKGGKYDGFLSGAKEWASNESAEMTQKGFTVFREELRDNFKRGVESSSAFIEPQVKNQLQFIKSFLPELAEVSRHVFEEISREEQISAFWTLKYLSLSHLFFTLVFTLLCVRSFCYIWARVAFDEQSHFLITLRDSKATEAGELPDPGSIQEHGSELVFGSEGGNAEFYFSRGFEPHGAPPRFAVPQPLAGPIARVLHGCWAMNRVSVGKDTAKVYFSTQKDARFLTWQLGASEEVVFDYRNFVGMSADLRLSVHISLRISSMLFDRIIYPVATGPGTLILIADGSPKFGDNEHTRSSMPANRLIAWQKNAIFSTASELNLVDVYFSDTYIKKGNNGALIMDADKRGAPKNGLTRFIKHFFMP